MNRILGFAFLALLFVQSQAFPSNTPMSRIAAAGELETRLQQVFQVSQISAITNENIDRARYTATATIAGVPVNIQAGLDAGDNFLDINLTFTKPIGFAELIQSFASIKNKNLASAMNLANVNDLKFNFSQSGTSQKVTLSGKPLNGQAEMEGRISADITGVPALMIAFKTNSQLDYASISPQLKPLNAVRNQINNIVIALATSDFSSGAYSGLALSANFPSTLRQGFSIVSGYQLPVRIQNQYPRFTVYGNAQLSKLFLDGSYQAEMKLFEKDGWGMSFKKVGISTEIPVQVNAINIEPYVELGFMVDRQPLTFYGSLSAEVAGNVGLTGRLTGDKGMYKPPLINIPVYFDNLGIGGKINVASGYPSQLAMSGNWQLGNQPNRKMGGNVVVNVDVNNPMNSVFIGGIDNFAPGKALEILTNVAITIPAKVDQVFHIIAPSKADMYIVPNLSGATVLGKSYPVGMSFAMKKNVLGWNADFLFNLNQQGMLVTGTADAVRMGNTFEFTGANGVGNPVMRMDMTIDNLNRIAASNDPKVEIGRVDGRLIVLGLVANTYLKLTPSSYDFDMYGNVFGEIRGSLKGSVTNLSTPLPNSSVTFVADAADLENKLRQSGGLGRILVNGFSVKSLDFSGRLADIQSSISAKIEFTVFGNSQIINVVLNPNAGGIVKQIEAAIRREANYAAGLVTGLDKDIEGVWGSSKNAFEKAVKEMDEFFTGSDKSRKKIRMNGPMFMLIHKPTGQALGTTSVEKGEEPVATSLPQKYWQVIPSNEKNYFYVVSTLAGYDWNVEGHADKNYAQIFMKQHAVDDRANEKVMVIPVPNEPGYYYFRFKHHKEKYYATYSNGRFYQFAGVSENAKFRLEYVGEKNW
ncbi:MAG: hypothetical protein R3D00_19040 [Bacteroidia bacterium]